MIKIKYKARQTGKTEELLKISSETKYPIICKNKQTVMSLKKIAKKKKLKIPDPISIYDIMNTSNPINARQLHGQNILIDDAEFILSEMFRKLCGAEIDTISITSRDEEGYVILPDGRSSKDIINGGI